MENSPFEADFNHITLYGSYIKPCCELVSDLMIKA